MLRLLAKPCTSGLSAGRFVTEKARICGSIAMSVSASTQNMRAYRCRAIRPRALPLVVCVTSFLLSTGAMGTVCHVCMIDVQMKVVPMIDMLRYLIGWPGNVLCIL